MSVRFEMRLPDELAAAIDGARGYESRANWLRRAAERALEAESSEAKGVPAMHEQAGPIPVGSTEPVRPAASPRAPAFNRVERLGGAARPIPRRS